MVAVFGTVVFESVAGYFLSVLPESFRSPSKTIFGYFSGLGAEMYFEYVKTTVMSKIRTPTIKRVRRAKFCGKFGGCGN